jgi:hypothetical protein
MKIIKLLLIEAAEMRFLTPKGYAENDGVPPKRR